MYGAAIGAGLGTLDTILGAGGQGITGDSQRKTATRELRKLQTTAPGYGDLYHTQDYIPEEFLDTGRSQWTRSGSAGGGAGLAQTRALQQMQEVARNGGYTASERAQIAEAQRESALGEQRQRAGIQADMARRGLGGSGVDMAARMQAQQAGANRAQSAANNIAVQGQQRALMAMQNAAQQASNMHDQGFRAASARNDAIDRFNVANTDARRGMQARNVQARRDTNAFNAGARGRAKQQAWQNQAAATGNVAAQYNANANAIDARYLQQNAQQNAQSNAMLGGIMSMGGGQ